MNFNFGATKNRKNIDFLFTVPSLNPNDFREYDY